jgi:hypothetical protein
VLSDQKLLSRVLQHTAVSPARQAKLQSVSRLWRSVVGKPAFADFFVQISRKLPPATPPFKTLVLSSTQTELIHSLYFCGAECLRHLAALKTIHERIAADAIARHNPHTREPVFYDALSMQFLTATEVEVLLEEGAIAGITKAGVITSFPVHEQNLAYAAGRAGDCGQICSTYIRVRSWLHSTLRALCDVSEKRLVVPCLDVLADVGAPTAVDTGSFGQNICAGNQVRRAYSAPMKITAQAPHLLSIPQFINSGAALLVSPIIIE